MSLPLCLEWTFRAESGFVSFAIRNCGLADQHAPPGGETWLYPLLTLFFALLVEALIWEWLRDNGQRDDAILQRRLAGYAELAFGDVPERPVSKHQILLGTLKKVELKATSLAAVLVFIAIALVTVGANDLKDVGTGLWFYCLLLPLLPMFVALTFDFFQKDNLSFDPADKRSDAKQLQDALMQDLLRKEHCFRFALTCTIAYTGAGFAAMLAAILFFR